MMRRYLFAMGCAGWLAIVFSTPAQMMRYSLSPDVLELTNCLAQPGRVPIPLTASNVNLEIVNWTTAPSPTNQPGEFLLSFRQPLTLGSMVTYEPGEVRFRTAGQWKALPPTYDGDRKMQVLAFPMGERVEAIKFVVPAKRQAGGVNYTATLPFLIFIPIRAINIAPDATVAVSSAAKPGGPAQPWLNKPETLVDGFVDAKQNFSTALRDAASTNTGPEWVRLIWPEEQGIRGLAFMSGSAEQGTDTAVVEAHAAEKGDPLAPEKPLDWQPLGLRTSRTSSFCAHEFSVITHACVTRGLRLRATNAPPSLSLGEIMVIQDLGTNAVPARKARAAKSK